MKERRKGVVERSSCRIYLHMSETHPRPPRTMRSAAINEKVQRGGRYASYRFCRVSIFWNGMGEIAKLQTFSVRWIRGCYGIEKAILELILLYEYAVKLSTV